MWNSNLDGRALHFHLAGINDQNFIMRDEETGSWWQQVTGCAFLGPLAGRCLDAVSWDEVAFAVFKRENPQGKVLLPAEESKAEYAEADWETKVAEYPTVTPVDPKDLLKPRDLVVGLGSGGASAAYPWKVLAERRAIADTVGDLPILILLHSDGRSLRCFDRRVDGRTLELSLEKSPDPPVVVDRSTGSDWDFSGTATDGPLRGRRLTRVSCLKDYWFDWKKYNPGTRVFQDETRPVSAP